MTIFLSVLITLVLFLFVVVIHECGHFFAARSVGVRVKEFGIGIPPRLKTLFRDRHQTIYTINALPIGGFVRLEGEVATELGPKSLRSKSLWAKIWVLSAGILANFLLAGIIFSCVFALGAKPLLIHTERLPFERTSLLIPSFDEARSMGMISASGVILQPVPGGIADRSGISSGSLIISVNSVSITHPDQALRLILSSHSSVVLEVERISGVREVVTLTKNKSNRIESIIRWQNLSYNQNFVYNMTLGESIISGFHEAYSQFLIAGESLYTIASRLISPQTSSERQEAVESLGGPVAAGKGVYSLLDMGASWQIYAIFAALLSVSIGFFNLLPFPALDGGRIAEEIFASCLSVFGVKRQSYDRYAHIYHAMGFIFLLGLSVMIALKDIFLS